MPPRRRSNQAEDHSIVSQPLAAPEPGHARRIPWLAALLSLVAPGLGQLYNGDLRRAAGFAALYVLWGVLMLSPVAATPMGFVAVVLLATVVYFLAVTDAFYMARRHGAIRLGRINRWYVYVAYPLLLFGFDSAMTPIRGIEVFSTAGNDNLPTLQAGDYIVAKGGGLGPVHAVRGDLVIFESPWEEGARYIRRLIALPGERVQMIRGRLHIDGRLVQREAVADATGATGKSGGTEYVETLRNGRHFNILETDDTAGPFNDTPEFLVPPGHFFALGDNRDVAKDSRNPEVGFIPLAAIERKAAFVLWAADWNRIGMRLD